MDFDNSYLNYGKSKYQLYHPNYLSSKLVIEAESKVILPSIEQIDNSIHVFFISISIFSVISRTLYKIISELATAKLNSLSILNFRQNPCKTCKFYHSNLYLKCAVHPSQVLTKDARNCIDYHSLA